MRYNNHLPETIEHDHFYTPLQFLAGFLQILEMAMRLSETHHARWMGSCLYILKMLLSGELFPLGPQQKVDVLMLSFYIIYIHFFFWISCRRMADAPWLTLTLHQDLTAWIARDADGAQAGRKKVDGVSHRSVGRSQPCLRQSG